MMNIETIKHEISDHQQKIDQLEIEKSLLNPGIHKQSILAVNNQLSYLRDNQYRNELQARAQGHSFLGVRD